MRVSVALMLAQWMLDQAVQVKMLLCWARRLLLLPLSISHTGEFKAGG